MTKEVLVHIRVHILLSKNEEFKNKLVKEYQKFKKLKIKNKDFYDKTTDLNKHFSFYELTYFDKMKDKKYKEMIEIESNLMINWVRMANSKENLKKLERKK